MNEEIKEILREAKEYRYIDLNTEKTDLFLDYITNLQQKVEQLENIIKEAKNYILDGRYGEDEDFESISLYMPDLLNILNKGSESNVGK